MLDTRSSVYHDSTLAKGREPFGRDIGEASMSGSTELVEVPAESLRRAAHGKASDPP
jgi:hypothetical protein